MWSHLRTLWTVLQHTLVLNPAPRRIEEQC